MVDWPTIVVKIAIAFGIGLGLGFFYFGGLWLTVQKVTQVKRPFLWLLGSFLLRFLGCCLVFYFVIGLEWEKLLSALGGFLLMRLIWVSKISMLSRI
jgi:F1F0 ATPase subunit 2